METPEKDPKPQETPKHLTNQQVKIFHEKVNKAIEKHEKNLKEQEIIRK